MKSPFSYISLFIMLTGLLVGFSTQIYAETPSWSQQSSAGHNWLSGRYGHAMAYLADDKLLMFGGMAQGRLQDTYVYDLSENSWQQITGDPKPDNRLSFGMAHIAENKVLLFGGDLALGSLGTDTWLYDETAHRWAQLNPPNSPGARRNLAMSYIGDDKVLLFGGYQGTSAGNSSETWVYDLSDGNWTLMQPANRPPGLQGHAMAYIGDDKVVLFGGMLVPATQNYSDETWVYDLSENNWVQKYPSSRPVRRQLHDMAYISPGRVVLYGGSVPGNPAPTARNDTWIYNISDNSWTELLDIPNPGARTLHAMSETNMQGFSKVVLFSGSVDYADTWVFAALGIGPACSDGIDNDGDGQTDYPNDSLCTGPTDTSESMMCFFIGKNPHHRVCIAQILIPIIVVIGILVAGFVYRRWRSKTRA